jgi:hypothetical protein
MYIMPKVKNTKIRIDNTNYITYVLKTYYNGTYKFFTYQQNQTSHCYFLVGVQSGRCR